MHVSPWSVVPKSENVDFRPTFCPFSRLTDLVQQNQDYHRTRREQAVILSPICIFRFFGTTMSTQTRENGQKKFFSRNRPYYSTLDSPWRDESNGTTFKWIWEKKIFRPFSRVWVLVGSDQKSEVKWPTQSDFLTIFTTIAYQNKLAELITCISLVFPYDIGVAQNRPKRDPKSAKKKSQLFFPWSDFNISGLKRTARSWTITCQKN